MRNQAAVLGLCSALAISCATSGPDQCEIEIVQVDSFHSEPGEFDVGYLVQGRAGSPAKAWLAARTGPQRYEAGLGVDVGPGPFKAVVELKLTGRPLGYTALLEVAGRRCRDETDPPAGM